MKKKLIILFIIAAIIFPQNIVWSGDFEEEQVKQRINQYFDLRYTILSSLEFDENIKTYIDPEMLNTEEAVTEADVLDTIVRFRSSQTNDLRFDRYDMNLSYEKLETGENLAWIIVTENTDLYFNCAPTVKNSISVRHFVTARKVNGAWYILQDDYEDQDGIKKKLVEGFIGKQISIEDAKNQVISESESQMDKRMNKLADIAGGIKSKNPIILFVGKSIAYCNGSIEKLQENGVVPVLENDRTFLPVRFIAQKLGAQVEWDENTSTVYISNSEHKIEIKAGETSLLADGRRINSDVPLKEVNKRMMVPARAIADAFGKMIFWDDRGLIIISDNLINPEEDKETIDALADFYQVLFTKANFPRIDGSTATYPLSIEMGKTLLGLDEMSAKGFITHKTTHNAYVNLIEGNADIIFVTQPSPEELQFAEENGVELEVVPVCREGFVFLVNKNNPVNSLSVKQVQEIYQGKIKEWNQVGGETDKIIPYQREANSGSQTIMENTVMKGMAMMEPPREVLVYGMGELIDRVADYSNAKNALGYSVYYFATQMYKSRSIKLISIDGVEPSKNTIQDGSYPFTVGYYAVVRKDEPQDSNARKLLTWLLGEEGQQVVDRAGLVPVK